MNTATNAAALALPAVGSKYVAERDLAVIAKLVRADIDAAVKAGALPAGLKARVQISRYSMGQSLDVRVTAVPGVCFLSVARIRRDVSNPHDHNPLSHLSPNGKAIEAMLEAIVNAYNRAGERGIFFGTAKFASEIETPLRAEIKAAVLGAKAAA